MVSAASSRVAPSPEHTMHAHPGFCPRPATILAAPSRTLLALATALMLGACSQASEFGRSSDTTTAALSTGAQAADPNRSELEKATEYWGKEYQKDPRALKPALAYAKNLKAMGQKELALGVLQQSSIIHTQDRELASEYGRLALEAEQVSLASKLLAVADDPLKPDWRVISARGTALAKLGKYGEAVPMFERARALDPNNPSVLNNLAMAMAANGQPDKAEELLRQALARRGDDAKIQQNLAIVLALQGRHDDAQQVGSQVAAITGDAESVRANADVLRKLVKAEPKPPAVAAAEPKAVAKNQTPAKAQPQVAAAGPMTDAQADALVAQAIAAAAKSENGTAVAGWKKDAGKPANR